MMMMNVVNYEAKVVEESIVNDSLVDEQYSCADFAVVVTTINRFLNSKQR